MQMVKNATLQEGAGDSHAHEESTGLESVDCDRVEELCHELAQCSPAAWTSVRKVGPGRERPCQANLSIPYLQQYLKLHKIDVQDSIERNLESVIGVALKRKQAKETKARIRQAMRIAADKMFKESQEKTRQSTGVALLAPISPAPDEMIDRGLAEMLQPSANDILYDLGCGDGRWLVAAAARYGCQCVGIEVDEERIDLARKLAKEHNVESKVSIRKGNLIDADIRDATMIVAYLFPEGVAQLGQTICGRVREGIPLLLPGFAIPESSGDTKQPMLQRKSRISDGRPMYLYSV